MLAIRFLWVRLQIDNLRRQKTRDEVVRALENLPKDLDGTYSNILRRIEKQVDDGKDIAFRALKLLVCAKRPLGSTELVEAIRIVEGERALRYTRVPDTDLEKTIVDVCQNLVSVDGQIGIFRFVHFSAKQYLDKSSVHEVSNPNWLAAELCLTVLCWPNWESLEANEPEILSKSLAERTREEPKNFSNYALHYWGEHLRLCCEDDSDGNGKVARLQDCFFEDDDDAFKAWSVEAPVVESEFFSSGDMVSIISSLFVACFYGLTRMVQKLLRDPKEGYGCSNEYGRNTLHTAARNGHAIIARLLVEAKLNSINDQDKDGRTALALAALNGNLEVVKVLIGISGIDVNIPDKDGRTALIHAAWRGSAEVVHELVKFKGIEVNLRDNAERTALTWAARNSHLNALKRLLRAENIDINSKDNRGRTPLMRALQKDDIRIFTALLNEDGIDINVRDALDWTPINFAIEYHKIKFIELMLQKPSIDVNCKDYDG